MVSMCILQFPTKTWGHSIHPFYSNFYIIYSLIVQFSGCGVVPDKVPGNDTHQRGTQTSALNSFERFHIKWAVLNIKEIWNDSPFSLETAEYTQKPWKWGQFRKCQLEKHSGMLSNSGSGEHLVLSRCTNIMYTFSEKLFNSIVNNVQMSRLKNR